MAKVVIASTTFFKDVNETRCKLALLTAEKAKEYGYPMMVVDGGSPEYFLTGLAMKGVVLSNEIKKGMGSSRRQAIHMAAERAGEDGVIVWMEPEKHPLIPQLNRVVRSVLDEEADLVIPYRFSMSSYPPEQALAEELGNKAVCYITARNLDLWFGPRVFNQKVAKLFLDYQGEYGDKWDSIFIPVLRAIAAGLKVIGVEVDYPHPLSQTNEETGNIDFLIKRIEQLLNLIPAIRKESQILGISKE